VGVCGFSFDPFLKKKYIGVVYSSAEELAQKAQCKKNLSHTFGSYTL
jgi:hypothetical protein